MTTKSRTYPDISYVETDTETIVNTLIQGYEKIAGRTLYPADPARLFILWVADIIVQERVNIDFSAKQNIPRYAEGEYLDSLAELFKGAERLEPEKARTTLQYTLSMHIEISNADAISFIIDPNVVTATKKDIADHDASKTAHAAEFEKKADVTDLNAHANNTDIHVNPSTMGNYDTAISGLIEHKEDTKIHVTAEEKASWTEGAEQAAADANRVTEALNAIAGIESRVSRVEDGLFNNITGNPFLASFDSLDGITLVKGIWNEERKRIEC